MPNETAAPPPRRIVIAGASGLIGQALTTHLEAQGHAVVRLVRSREATAGERRWDPAAGELDADALEGVDAIVNLAGANVGAGRWTALRREAIRRSRIDATTTLVNALSKLRRRPAVLVNASAVGFYGDRGDETLNESSGPGDGFLAEVCQEWEAAAAGAERHGVRAIMLRFGVVFAPRGGALEKLLPVFRCGVGGRIGSGRQWMSWVAIDDAVRVLTWSIDRADARGAFNATAPEPVTNAVFAATLARVLRRPAILPVPATVLRLAMGEMAEATILASTRAVPRRLAECGFGFLHPTLEAALRRVLDRR